MRELASDDLQPFIRGTGRVSPAAARNHHLPFSQVSRSPGRIAPLPA